jgi:Raf kinase inhibitor-like YbhB/YbcL family protein
MRLIFVVLLAAVSLLAACQAPASDTTGAVQFELSSPAFADSSSIPQKFTCQGDDISPELNWSEAPAGAKSFALIVDDPDAPAGTFTHWVLFDIPAGAKQLAEDAGPVGVSGNNSSGQAGYTGPCPPSGSHRYYFRLYALDVPSLNLKAGTARSEVEAAMEKHIVGTAETMGRYEKQ